ncbi:thioredoxin family protein [Lentibacillus halophilus]|uniref:Thioredoxin family protein n=1 Tax=Lentibacillus halophilus TaxID=295065 RepID=A0ABP3IWZ1_9BACI
MRSFTELRSIDAIDLFTKDNRLSLLFVSRPGCSVCHDLLPQVQTLMKNYPKIQLGYINADDVETIAGHFSIFTVPVILVCVEGKEIIREARIVHMDLFKEKLDKLYKNVAG